MKIKYDPEFIKKLKKANVRIRKNFEKRIKIFSQNSNDPQLNNHALKREYLGLRSIDITADWRAIYQEIKIKDNPIAYFIILGTHEELYKN